MLDILAKAKISGSVIVNGKNFSSITEALSAYPSGAKNLTVVLNRRDETVREVPKENKVAEVLDEKTYKIKVRQYMTKPSSPDFPFHDKWNDGKPMPMRVMVGRILKETKGMYQMELWGQITEETTNICMMCGRPLTNPVSRYFGIGPECGNHGYVNPFESDEALREAVAETNRKLMAEKRWTGWVIKSAIESWEEIIP